MRSQKIVGSPDNLRKHSPQSLLITTRSELRKVLFLAPSVCVFGCIWNTLGTAERIYARFTRKIRLVHRLDEFEGQGQRLNAKVTRDNRRHFSTLSAACVLFMFGKTSLASVLILSVGDLGLLVIFSGKFHVSRTQSKLQLNGIIMALILRYFTEFVYDVVVKSASSLSHLLMSYI